MSETVMTKTSRGTSPAPDTAIVFGERLADSEGFRDLFREGMALVEETASYLDGVGREDSRGLGRSASLAYTTESMRLTTRLMQLASWLLLQRAVNEGEITHENAMRQKSKIRLEGAAAAVNSATFAELPEQLRGLIERSMRLQERLRHLDKAIYGTRPAPAANPVARTIGRLTDAFSPRRG
jgi:regulator of CtrA degradation